MVKSGENLGKDQRSFIFKISLRREDYKMVLPSSSREDVVQCNTAPSTMTPRGHQFPAAFMSVASGVWNHGLNQQDPSQQLAYTHCDIAGAAEEEGSSSGSLSNGTGCPVVTFTTSFVPFQ